MYAGQYVFAQVMDFLPLHVFRRCVARYNGERRVKRFSCLDQYLCLAFAQLTWRESLRDIEACLRAQSSKLYHLGFRNAIARNTLANANAVRDWRIYAGLAQHLIGIARRLYADDPLALELDETVYALDSTTIDLRSGFLEVIKECSGRCANTVKGARRDAAPAAAIGKPGPGRLNSSATCPSPFCADAPGARIPSRKPHKGRGGRKHANTGPAAPRTRNRVLPFESAR